MSHIRIYWNFGPTSKLYEDAEINKKKKKDFRMKPIFICVDKLISKIAVQGLRKPTRRFTDDNNASITSNCLAELVKRRFHWNIFKCRHQSCHDNGYFFYPLFLLLRCVIFGFKWSDVSCYNRFIASNVWWLLYALTSASILRKLAKQRQVDFFICVSTG